MVVVCASDEFPQGRGKGFRLLPGMGPTRQTGPTSPRRPPGGDLDEEPALPWGDLAEETDQRFARLNPEADPGSGWTNCGDRPERGIPL